MWKSLSVVFLVWICAAASPPSRKNQEYIDDKIRGIMLGSSQDEAKMPDIQLTKDLSNSELVSLVNSIFHSLAENGTLSKEGSLKLKDMIGNYVQQHRENFTVDGEATDKATGTDAMLSFLQNLKLKDGDFDYTIERTLHNEIDIEEEEEETDDPLAKDQIVVDYIKNIDKTIAVEGEDPDNEPNERQLKKLFNIMTL